MSDNWSPIISLKDKLNQLDSGSLYALCKHVGFFYKEGIKKEIYVEALWSFFKTHSRYPVPTGVTSESSLMDIATYMLSQGKDDPTINLTPMPRDNLSTLVHWLGDNHHDAEFNMDVYKEMVDPVYYGAFNLETFYAHQCFTISIKTIIEVNSDDYKTPEVEMSTNEVGNNAILAALSGKYNGVEQKGDLPTLKEGFTTTITDEEYPRVLLKSEGIEMVGPPFGLDFRDLSTYSVQMDGISSKVMLAYSSSNMMKTEDIYKRLAILNSSITKEQAAMLKYEPSEEHPFNMPHSETVSRCINLPIYGKIISGQVIPEPNDFIEKLIEVTDNVKPFIPVESKWMERYVGDLSQVTLGHVQYGPSILIYCIPDDQFIASSVMGAKLSLMKYNIDDEEKQSNIEEVMEYLVKSKTIIERPTVNMSSQQMDGMINYIYNNYETYGVSDDVPRIVGMFDDFMAVYVDPTGKTVTGRDKLIADSVNALFDNKTFNPTLVAYALAMFGFDISEVTAEALIPVYNFIMGSGVTNTETNIPDRPQNYCNALSDEYMKSFLKIYNVNIASILGREALVDIVTRGYIHPLPIEDKLKVRDSRWSSMNEYQKLLYKIYTSESDPYIHFLQVETDPVEAFIYDNLMDAEHTTLNAFAEKYGMIIPHDISAADYISQCFNSMVEIYTGSTRPTLDFANMKTYLYYTDSELCSSVKAYPGHSTRDELIRNIHAIQTGESNMFFWPFPGTCNSQNDTYYGYGEKFEEDLSPYAEGEYPICFGNRKVNYGYSVGQLVIGFDENYGQDNQPTGTSEGSPLGSPSRQGSPSGSPQGSAAQFVPTNVPGSPDARQSPRSPRSPFTALPTPAFVPPTVNASSFMPPTGHSPTDSIPSPFMPPRTPSLRRENQSESKDGEPEIATSKNGRSFRIYDLPSGNYTAFMDITKNNVDQLKILINSMRKNYPDIDNGKEATETTKKLLREIDICEIYINNVNEFDRRVISKFHTFNDVEKEKISIVLNKMFFAGMYFRQWRGEGPYPMKMTETLNTVAFDKDKSTAKAEQDLNNSMFDLSPTSLEFVRGLRTVKNANGYIISQNDTFGPYWDNIIGKKTSDMNTAAYKQRAIYFTNRTISENPKSTPQEKEVALSNMNAVLNKHGGQLPSIVSIDDNDDSRCIRISSSYLVGTGYHYGLFFKSFTSKEINGFDPTKLENIS